MNVHWETQGHLELATGGTTTVNRAVSQQVPSRLVPSPTLVPLLQLLQPPNSELCGVSKASLSRSGGRLHLPLLAEFLHRRRGLFSHVGCPPSSFSPRKARIGVQSVHFQRYRGITHEILAILSY